MSEDDVEIPDAAVEKRASKSKKRNESKVGKSSKGP